MKQIRVALLIALCAFPAISSAQRVGAGEKRQPRLPGESGPRLRLPTRADFEDLSPASFLRDKRKRLQLGDADVNALKATESAANERNNVVLAAYDSVRREMQKLADSPNLGDNANDAALRRMAFSNLTDQIREERGADRADAIAAIAADKRTQPDALLKEQDDEFLRKMGSAGGGRRGGGL